MQSILKIICIVVLALSFSSCKKESKGSCLMGAGVDATERRNLKESFHEIKAEDNIHLLLIQDSLNYIQLKGGKNLLPYIETEIRDGVLHFKNHAKCTFLKGYEHDIKAELHFTSFKTIWNWGSGNISSNDTLRFDTLLLNAQESIGKYDLILNNYKTMASLHTGVSDFLLKGFSHDFFCYSRGTGNIKAAALKSEFVYANNISALDFFVGSPQRMEVLIQYKGSIYYKGNPSIQYQAISGEGKLIKED
jgi:hypothetical protein